MTPPFDPSDRPPESLNTPPLPPNRYVNPLYSPTVIRFSASFAFNPAIPIVDAYRVFHVFRPRSIRFDSIPFHSIRFVCSRSRSRSHFSRVLQKREIVDSEYFSIGYLFFAKIKIFFPFRLSLSFRHPRKECLE